MEKKTAKKTVAKSKSDFTVKSTVKSLEVSGPGWFRASIRATKGTYYWKVGDWCEGSCYVPAQPDREYEVCVQTSEDGRAKKPWEKLGLFSSKSQNRKGLSKPPGA